jgi:putative cardiolipin synthase
MLTRRTLHTLVMVMLFSTLSACVSLPTDYPRAASSTIQDAGATRLGRGLDPLVAAHPGQSGLYPLQYGVEAFVARLVLAEAAEKSLDVQYYIWHDDQTGKLLTEGLLRAADRGVRVRLLLDDLGTSADDAGLLMLDAHPRIEVRLFNPVATRKARGLGMLLDFERVNRRMHNKSFTADNRVGIVGGRNIGDEYFEARSDLDFGDLDAMTIGPVVGEISTAFDLYWNSPAAFPVAALSREQPAPESTVLARAALTAYVERQRDSAYVQALRQSRLANQLRSGEVPFFWGRAWLVHDDPAKIASDPGDVATALLPRLKPAMDGMHAELLVVSPYFVPGKAGVAWLGGLVARGIKVKVLTNSLASSDVSAVHAGYAKYREPLLRAGVELYEAKPDAGMRSQGEQGNKRATGLPGSSRASLHAKVFGFDRRTVFVGSLNLDPRSVKLNTEIGVVFESPELGRMLADGMERAAKTSAWRLVLSTPESGSSPRIEWVAHEDGREVRLTSEPRVSAWRRFGVWFMSLLPIEAQL